MKKQNEIKSCYGRVPQKDPLLYGLTSAECIKGENLAPPTLLSNSDNIRNLSQICV